MSTDSPIETLAAALHAACLRDLPEIEYRDRDWAAHRKFMDSLSKEEKAEIHAKEKETGQAQGPFVEKKRRPSPHDCEVVMFPQTWGSTALGFGGVGGQAITSAYTVVVECARVGAKAVYFGGRFAYLVPYQAPLLPTDEQARRFLEHMAVHILVECSKAPEAYGATQP